MWLLLILTAVAHENLVLCNLESVPESDISDDPVADEPMYLYLDERSFDLPRRENIEERRRSALDKNFMRFGRGGAVPLNDLEPFDYDEFSRPERSKSNFLRFGRHITRDGHIRFGRSDKNFIRFGRSLPLKRSRRDVYSGDDYKRNSNFLRFGRNENFMRFGRNNENNKIAPAAKNIKDRITEADLFTLLAEIASKMKDNSKFNGFSERDG